MADLIKHSSSSIYPTPAELVASGIFLLLLVIVVLCFLRAKKNYHAFKEAFLSKNATGTTLECSAMNRTIMQSSPRCGLNLPQTTTGKICIDGACLDARKVNDLTSISDKVKNQKGILLDELAKLHERLDTIGENKRTQLSKISKLGEKMSKTKGMLRSILPVDASGGDTVYNYDGHRVHVFRQSGTLDVKVGGEADVLVVGGGGSGNGGGGGGGAGAVVFKKKKLDEGRIEVVVGRGGSGGMRRNANKGESSEFLNISAEGGGCGMYLSRSSRRSENNGGSGGGGSRVSTFGTGGEYGNHGGEGWQVNGSGHTRGSGGGGAGERGIQGTNTRAGRGGNGVDLSSFFGKRVGDDGWVGGGGGGSYQGRNHAMAAGGSGGGGKGGRRNNDHDAEDGMSGTGGGGGAGGEAGSQFTRNGSGGSGLVVVRYPLTSGDIPKRGALDGTSKPIAVYAVRRLFGDYAGPQVRIRRTDDTEADVYFDEHGRVTAVKDDDGSTSMVLHLNEDDYKVVKLYNQGSYGHKLDMNRYYSRTGNEEKVYIDTSDHTVVIKYMRRSNNRYRSETTFGIDVNKLPATRGTIVMSRIGSTNNNNGFFFHDRWDSPLDEHGSIYRDGNTGHGRGLGQKVSRTIAIREDRALVAGLQCFGTIRDNIPYLGQKLHAIVIDDDSANMVDRIVDL